MKNRYGIVLKSNNIIYQIVEQEEAPEYEAEFHKDWNVVKLGPFGEVGHNAQVVAGLGNPLPIDLVVPAAGEPPVLPPGVVLPDPSPLLERETKKREKHLKERADFEKSYAKAASTKTETKPAAAARPT